MPQTSRLTDQVDDAILRYNVSKPLPLGGDPGHVTIQPDFFFNKDLEYLRIKVELKKSASMTSLRCNGISHWCFKDKRIYTDRHTSEGELQSHEPSLTEDKKNPLLLSQLLDQKLWLISTTCKDIHFHQAEIESYKPVNLTKTKTRWDAKGL
ncbi:hypothetical protein Tco_0780827 [Tanacetum coccineum]